MTAGAITDVAGLRVGQAERVGEGWLTGTTVVLAPPEGVVGGVDVRGGGPGTRETDLLDPRNLVERVHAVVLSGGSALGLAAADGVARRLLRDGVGFPVGGAGEVVPIVPGAVIFDLGRGGAFAHHPDAGFGEAAYDDALLGSGSDVEEGNHGAGAGARAGGLKGGVGTASATLPSGGTVGALVVVNAAGSCVDPTTGELWAARHCSSGDLPHLVRPAEAELLAAKVEAAARDDLIRPPLATTLVVIGTDATLTKAQCAKVSGIGHDGLARAINPVHTMFDGDTVFGLATGETGAPDLAGYQALLAAAADCFTRAVLHAVLAATTVETPAGRWLCYRDAFPSAFAQ